MPPKKKGKKDDAEEQKKKEEEEANKAAAAAAAEEEAALQAAEEAAMRKMEDLTARWIPSHLYLSTCIVISTIIQHCCQPGPHELHHCCVLQTQRRGAEDDRPHPGGPALDPVHEGGNIFSVLLKYF